MPNQFKPVIFMLLSTFSLSITGLLAKHLSEQISPAVLSFLRFSIPCILLFIFVIVTNFVGRNALDQHSKEHQRSGSKQWLPPKSMHFPIVIRALCIAACQICFLISLQSLSLVESVVLFSTGPLFIPLLEKLIFGVKVSIVTVFGLTITFSGVLLLAGDVSGIHFKPELLLGLMAGVFNSGSQLSLYRATKGNMTPIELNAWTFLIASLCLIPAMMMQGQGVLAQDVLSLTNADTHVFHWLVIVSLALLVINTQVFRAKAYKLVDSGSQLAPLIFTNLLFTSVWQWQFLEHTFSTHQLQGIGLIITASIINTFMPRVQAHYIRYKAAKVVSLSPEGGSPLLKL
ncbi:EamA family transporter [Vibrionales bacterium C3R12]|nr:EamA family transporter [Vibrionales bacterium C3R12]